MNKKFDRIITFGTFDLFHIGHLNIITRAKKLCNTLIVGISTDNLNFAKKNTYPIYNENDRLSIVSALRDVDFTFFEESLELKSSYILEYKADVLIMGDDWEGKFDELSQFCDVIYLPRTPNISSTEIKITVTERT
ncbi:pantoate--beta-alanine ligase [Pseudomonas sp. CFBP 8770]|uniref:pantoate--beta-alanine ligase n=1 Tax=unclassified Pseudomonas TaxID=196821 RepID=UPI001783033F|nr:MULTISPECIES: pantoate--beta-alanine ligase [unclassified Pseudomonas]MBD8472761.1 pantoate--beta-alanine ligase [Pseudomonas sp. CFBP 8773]MBD8646137.1 pantoate--beta-alanine ligase [Pseudomonas sp. CFBP 8770]